VRVHGRYHVDNPEAVVDAAIAGLGVALLPDYLCNDALEQGSLSRVLPNWTPQTRFGTLITAVATPDRMRLSRNRALLNFLRLQLVQSDRSPPASELLSPR
jgi:DNA-binding transcriptional LysR family regulator